MYLLKILFKQRTDNNIKVRNNCDGDNTINKKRFNGY